MLFMSNKLFGVISIYGLLIALAILLGTVLCQREARRRGLPRDTGIDMILWAVPPAVICARVYYVVFRWRYYAADPLSALYFWQGGLAIYGAVIGGFLGLLALSRKNRLPLLTLLDIAAPLVILGQAIGRWGNYFNGEAYGSPVLNPAWQFFPVAVFADGAWRLATFFYESCWNALGFVILWLYRKKAGQPGDVFFRYLLWYGAGRTVIEGLRADSLMLGPLRVSQALSVVLCLFALIVILQRKKKASHR
ncbi:MAG: prolipoprotein diacylglyceryl transferase [Clostridia bacterium]|nr:prolipoprotein diacylglyceryl transferase [Clostridia bacterium]